MSEPRAAGSAGSEATFCSDAAEARMPPLSRSLPMLLLWAREAMMQRFRPELTARGLTDQQWRVIRVLVDAQPCEIYELSARTGIHPASLSRILPKLAADGIVSRSANAKDQRRVIVSLTAEGRRVFEGGIAALERTYAQLAQEIGSGEIEHITQSLENLIAALGARDRGGRPRMPAAPLLNTRE